MDGVGRRVFDYGGAIQHYQYHSQPIYSSGGQPVWVFAEIFFLCVHSERHCDCAGLACRRASRWNDRAEARYGSGRAAGRRRLFYLWFRPIHCRLLWDRRRSGSGGGGADSDPSFCHDIRLVSRKAGLYDGRGVCRRWGGVLCMDAGGEPAVGGPRAGLDLSFPRVGYAGRRPAAEPVLRFYAKRSARGAAGAERKGAGD